MKIKRIIAAAASVVLLLSAPVFSTPAMAKTSFDLTALHISELSVKEFNIDDYPPVLTSVEEAAAHIRESMRARQDTFYVTISKGIYSNAEEAGLKLLADALKETSDGREGDYLRFCLGSYQYGFVEYPQMVTLIYRATYNTTAEQEQQTDKAVSAALDSLLLRGRSEYETIKAIYDYIVTNVSYADEPDENEPITDYSIFTAYGAAVNGKAVCQGYSMLLYRMLKDAGISCRIISGTSKGVRHTWNIAKANGKYYLLDVTWDVPLGGSSGGFFMKGTDDFDEFSPKSKHIAIYEYETIFSDYNSDSFKSEYPVSAVKIEPPVYTIGDIDGNGIVDGRDATAVLTAYAVASVRGAYPLSEEQLSAADVTGNGITDGIDASMILSFYAASSAGKADNIIEYIQKRT